MAKHIEDNKTIIRFEPIMPVRDDVIGERIFTRDWQSLVGGRKAIILHWDEDGIPRHDDFRGFGPYQTTLFHELSFYSSMARIGSFPADRSMADVWQRRASVATSFVKWLGTNFGRHFLEDADKTYDAMQEARVFPNYRSSAYAMTWAQRNNDSDGRQRLAIVVESYTTSVHGFGVINNYTCSYDDVRVIEEMAAWLGTETGHRFVTTCRAKIDRAVKREKTRRHAAENARRIGLGLQPVPLPKRVMAHSKKKQPIHLTA